MTPTTLHQAIEITIQSAKEIFPLVSNIQVEETVLTDDKSEFHVTLSFNTCKSEQNNLNNKKVEDLTAMDQLSSLMSNRRQYKIFFIDRSNGELIGFKKYND